MHQKIMELGRSMVEMLGVLAIIGVLSIVGISGYQKAILKLQANEAWDAATKFRAEVQSYSLMHPDKKNTYHGMKNSGDASVVWLNRLDLLPDFAKGSFDNFHVLVVPYGNMQFKNIKIKHLCRTILSSIPGTEAACSSGNCKYKTHDGITYYCYAASGVDW